MTYLDLANLILGLTPEQQQQDATIHLVRMGETFAIDHFVDSNQFLSELDLGHAYMVCDCPDTPEFFESITGQTEMTCPCGFYGQPVPAKANCQEGETNFFICPQCKNPI